MTSKCQEEAWWTMRKRKSIDVHGKAQFVGGLL